MTSVGLLVKLRDHHQALADAYNEEIEKQAPPEIKHSEEDFDKLSWESKQGTKGSYGQTSKKANNNHPVFQALQAILKEKKGFCILGSYKYWFDNQNPEVIDRRKK